MASLLERVQEALDPRFLVDRELARGGMGVVFLARDPLLDRDVAIKVLAPELATEAAARRFLREAQILARLTHPNILPVHVADEADGIFYYVMDYIEGATLAHRLLRDGALPMEEVLQIGRDILHGLEATHTHQIVHCDIKPANIFLDAGRAMVGDFGIATPAPDSDQTVTGVGWRGTPQYMAPEQFQGTAVPPTDLYAVGMVLFEAATGHPWEAGRDPAGADWSAVPHAMRPVLRRALAPNLADRWPDARSFRRAWWHIRKEPYVWRAAALAVGGLVAGGLLVWALLPTPSVAANTDGLVRIAPFTTLGVAPPGLTDSIQTAFGAAMQTSADLQVCHQLPCRDTPAVLVGRVTAGDSVTIEVRSSERPPLILVRHSGPQADWRATTDRVTADIRLALWSENSPLAAFLPVLALPVTSEGRTSFFNAEDLWSEGRYAQARTAYEQTFALDPTCFLCSWRITEMQRWLSEDPDSAHLTNVIDHPGMFSGNYEPLTRARTQPLDRRLATLDSLIDEQPAFFLAWFAQGDELLHRGPLLGHHPLEALAHLREVTPLNDDFSPVYEHLLWLYTALGHRDSATAALQRLNELPSPKDVSTAAYRMLLNLGYQLRFDPAGAAGSLSEIAASDVFNDRRIPVAPRLMMSFGTPDGAIGFGQYFASMTGRPRIRFAGQVAQFVGHFAKGQMARADSIADGVFPPREDFAAFAAQMRAIHALFDRGAPDDEIRAAAAALRAIEGLGAHPGSAEVRESTAWVLALLAGLRPDLVEQPSGPSVTNPALRTVLRAAEVARSSRSDALRLLEDLRDLEITADIPWSPPNPFTAYVPLRSVVHLLRAAWLEADDVPAAARELRWHHHLYQADLPTDHPVPQEADWGLGTLARWQSARLLDRAGTQRLEACAGYRTVVDRWSGGEARYRDYAQTARERLTALNCDVVPA